MFRKAIITTAILLLVCFCPAKAQTRQQPVAADSIITLLNAEWAKLTKIGYRNFRLIKGPAAFFHNGAYMFCDSAAWDIDREVIKAYGRVRLVQDQTILRSDSLTYLINEDLAQFRGPLVDVFNSEGDTLRTNNLDYNTRDSLAIFRHGGSMKDRDGNVIEGTTGIYAAAHEVFTFQENVQMFTDSIFLITEKMDYLSAEKKAYFRDKTYVWRENGFVKALAGWYDTDNDVICFSNDVYINDPDYEMWADEVYYYRRIPRYEAYHNVQVLDTLHEAAFVAHKAIVVTDSLNNQHMEFTLNPAVFYYGENENHVKDSLFFAADTLLVYTVRRCDIPDADVSARMKERDDILFDAIAEAENKAAEARRKAMAEAEAKRPENIARQKREKLAAQATIDSLAELGIPAPDSLYKVAGLDASEEKSNLQGKFGPLTGEVSPLAQLESLPADTTAVAAAPVDSTAAPAVPVDSIATPAAPADTMTADKTVALPDTSKIRYLQGWPNARVYRSDMQLLCDSLAYSDIDSLARMYGNPVMWYKTRNQLTSDLMVLLMKDETLHKGSMQQNAMLIMQEDSVHFDQIKSTEMVGHFRDDDLYRYDALGGVNAMFYLKEKEEITTINIKESQFMAMYLKDGVAQRIKYYEQTQSDAHPVYNLDIEKQRIKGFHWRGDERPTSRYAISDRHLRQSEREDYANVRMPMFRISDRYFDKYMSKIYEQIIAREDARLKASAKRDSSAAPARDSLRGLRDSLAILPRHIPPAAADTLAAEPVAEPAEMPEQAADAGTEEPVAVEAEPQILPTEPQLLKEEKPAVAPERKLTARERRILRRADRMIQRSDKRFFRKLYKEVR